MHARTARYSIDPDRCDAAVQSFSEAGAQIGAMDGFRGGYLLVDSENGEVVTLTCWESHAALDASDVRASSLRRDAVTVVEGSVESVARYDVVRELGS
jgi:heme-degrading monooxygenase HmoA